MFRTDLISLRNTFAFRLFGSPSSLSSLQANTEKLIRHLIENEFDDEEALNELCFLSHLIQREWMYLHLLPLDHERNESIKDLSEPDLSCDSSEIMDFWW